MYFQCSPLLPGTSRPLTPGLSTAETSRGHDDAYTIRHNNYAWFSTTTLFSTSPVAPCLFCPGSHAKLISHSSTPARPHSSFPPPHQTEKRCPGVPCRTSHLSTEKRRLPLWLDRFFFRFRSYHPCVRSAATATAESTRAGPGGHKPESRMAQSSLLSKARIARSLP